MLGAISAFCHRYGPMRLILYFVLFLRPDISNAQPVLIENSLSRILYYGIENSIKIHVPGSKPSQLKLSVSHGEIIQTDSLGGYSWKICEPNNQFRTTLRIYKESMLIDSLIFKLKPLPDPTILVPEKGHRSSAVRILSRGVHAEISNFDITNIPCKILSFEFALVTKTDPSSIFIKNEGAFLNEEAKKMFMQATQGDKYIVRNVVVQIGCWRFFEIDKEYVRILD